MDLRLRVHETELILQLFINCYSDNNIKLLLPTSVILRERGTFYNSPKYPEKKESTDEKKIPPLIGYSSIMADKFMVKKLSFALPPPQIVLELNSP